VAVGLVLGFGEALRPVLEQVGQQVAHRFFPATAVLSATAHDLGVFGRAERLALAAGRADALLQPCALGLPELEPGLQALEDFGFEVHAALPSIRRAARSTRARPAWVRAKRALDRQMASPVRVCRQRFQAASM
jgi:hypothetical protein